MASTLSVLKSELETNIDALKSLKISDINFDGLKTIEITDIQKDIMAKKNQLVKSNSAIKNKQ